MATSDLRPVPSLSSDGWVTDIVAKSDYLLAHFFASEITQTHFFPNNVHSLTNLVQLYNDDPIELGSKVRDSLDRYLRAYFTGVEVRAFCQEEAEKPGTWAIHMYIVVRNEDGDSYNMANIAQYEGSKIMKISKINDGA